MRLIKETKKQFINGLYVKMGLFHCGRCGKKVEKQLLVGKRSKSCNCATYNKPAQRNQKPPWGQSQ